jgi:hypothetical protein
MCLLPPNIPVQHHSIVDKSVSTYIFTCIDYLIYDKALKAGQIYTLSKVNTKLGNNTRGQN